jgi:F-type H+-transporting ATPase subunit gamma
MPSTRDIRRRIKSITNTQQITRAMQMVAAAKMRKAQGAAARTRIYAKFALDLLVDLSVKTKQELHPLLAKNKGEKILLVLISTDKGLCGGLNTNILKAALEFVGKNKNVEFLCVGKKGRDFTSHHGFKVVAEFLNFGDKFNLLDMSAVAQIPIQEYRKKSYGRIYLLYTDFLSTLRQKPTKRQLLPIEQKELIKLEELEDRILSRDLDGRQKDEIKSVSGWEYIFEPSPDKVLEVLLPRLCEMQIYQAVLESNASEHSARMVAMKNATDAAGDIISDLQLTFNQARQAAITREIAEISAGSIAP